MHFMTSCSSDGPPPSLPEPTPAASSTCFALASIDKTAKLIARLENHRRILPAHSTYNHVHKPPQLLNFRLIPAHTIPPPQPPVPSGASQPRSPQSPHPPAHSTGPHAPAAKSQIPRTLASRSSA